MDSSKKKTESGKLMRESPHRGLEAWKKGMELVEDIYRVTKNFPEDEKYGLVSQLRRAAISVPSNISEGAGRRTDGEFINYLSISIGSLSELDTQIELAMRLGYLQEEKYKELIDKIDHCKALTFGLRKSILNRNKK